MDVSLSFIIPVYNVESYLPACIDSILALSLQRLDIILVDDGSTDRSGEIADRYAEKDSRVQVVHQENAGLAAARNRGMELAKGEYLAFVDSDDWLIGNRIVEILEMAVRGNADMGMGNLLFCYPDGREENPFLPIPEELVGKVTEGRYCFAKLMKRNACPPMVCGFLYRREWLQGLNLRFENVLHEDELWTPMALCQARRVVVTCTCFYGYRQREGSIMNTLKQEKRIRSLVFIANRLIRFAESDRFDSGDREVKSQLYVKCYWLYSLAFTRVARIRDSRFVMPPHHLFRLFMVRNLLSAEAKRVCISYYRAARRGLREYLLWRIGYWVETTYSCRRILPEKKLILVYNTMWKEPLDIPVREIPADCLITTDRRYLKEADLVVFHLPTLEQELEGDLDKPEGQKWVAWSLECEENYPFMKDAEFMEVFDYRMSYHQDADIVFPYYRYQYIKELSAVPVTDFHRKKNICMLISSPFNKSGRKEYLQELMQFVEIDSYGKVLNNRMMEHDSGNKSKMELYKDYKFVIAFENSCAPDYVTEKFYDPLLAGAVPIYLGAPNIREFAPGEGCFVHVPDFDSPASLGAFLNNVCSDERLYNEFLQWKNKPLASRFLQMAEKQQINPFIRLCQKSF